MRIPDEAYSRRPGFMRAYAAEAARMTAPPAEKQPERQTPAARDETVLLPILLLLMTEGADKWLLLALLYILM